MVVAATAPARSTRNRRLRGVGQLGEIPIDLSEQLVGTGTGGDGRTEIVSRRRTCSRVLPAISSASAKNPSNAAARTLEELRPQGRGATATAAVAQRFGCGLLEAGGVGDRQGVVRPGPRPVAARR